MTFKLTILGSSSALPTSKRFPAAHVLNVHERFFLIDCGEGTQMQLRNNHIPFAKLNHLFISHLHGDHYFGLIGLITTLGLLGRTSELHIYAHKDLQTITMSHLNFLLKRGEKLGYRLVFHTITPGIHEQIYEDSKVTIHTFPLVHRIESNGFLFREKPTLRNLIKTKIDFYQIPIAQLRGIKEGADFVTDEGKVITNKELTTEPHKPRSYAYCSDTMYSETLLDYVKDIDVLFHESTFLDDMADRALETKHSTAKQAAEIAKKANVKKLLLGHFSSRYKDLSLFEREAREVFKESYAVTEGNVYEI